MSRLTNFDRTQILEQETIRKFSKQIESLKQEILKELERQFEQAKPKWMTEEIENSGFIQKDNYILWPKEEPFLSCIRHGKNSVSRLSNYFPINLMQGYGLIPVKTKSLVKKAEAYNKAIAEKNLFEAELRKILHSMTSWKALTSSIPELKDYEPQGKTSTALIPVESIQKIRKALKR